MEVHSSTKDGFLNDLNVDAACLAQFPTCFQLIAATHPCKCGLHGDKSGRCQCTADQVQRYLSNIPEPLLDRIDLHVEVNRPEWPILAGHGQIPEDSAMVRKRVVAARKIQIERPGIPDAQMGNSQVRTICYLNSPLEDFLESVAEKMRLSPRVCQRILKVSRTVADMDQSESIREEHLAEAVVYRQIDHKLINQ